MRTYDYLIGGHSIRLPEGHDLPETQEFHRRYDFILGELARLVSEKYPGSTRIDIGANVGDSWALMNKHVVSDTLLVEGDPTYTELLEFNMGRLGHPAQICKVFCGVSEKKILETDIVRGGGTSSIWNAPKGNNTESEFLGDTKPEVPMLTFQQLLDLNPKFKESKLIKLDTDGYDFSILKANASLLSKMQATLFYECAPYAVDENIMVGVSASIESFLEINKFFKSFIIYDNYGHFMCSFEGDESIKKYLELMVFNISSHMDDKHPIIYYYDIVAFTTENYDLYTRLKDYEISRFFPKS